MQPHVIFNSSIGRIKPQTYVKKELACPFCDRDQLTDIIDVDGTIMLLKNKYPVLQETLQTVIIETDECNSDLSNYTEEHVVRLFNFLLTNWFSYMKKPDYKSVILFRNYGPLSGGTIAHPHSQIVCFQNYDYKQNIHPNDFEGIQIEEKNGVIFNLSTKPRIGFTEFNVIMEELKDIKQFALYTQKAADFILNHFPYKCSSYNIFFYHFQGKVISKVIPRFVTSPLFVGYSIQQVPNNLEDLISAISEYL